MFLSDYNFGSYSSYNEFCMVQTRARANDKIDASSEHGRTCGKKGRSTLGQLGRKREFYRRDIHEAKCGAGDLQPLTVYT